MEQIWSPETDPQFILWKDTRQFIVGKDKLLRKLQRYNWIYILKWQTLASFHIQQLNGNRL